MASPDLINIKAAGIVSICMTMSHICVLLLDDINRRLHQQRALLIELLITHSVIGC